MSMKKEISSIAYSDDYEHIIVLDMRINEHRFKVEYNIELEQLKFKVPHYEIIDTDARWPNEHAKNVIAFASLMKYYDSAYTDAIVKCVAKTRQKDGLAASAEIDNLYEDSKAFIDAIKSEIDAFVSNCAEFAEISIELNREKAKP